MNSFYFFIQQCYKKFVIVKKTHSNFTKTKVNQPKKIMTIKRQPICQKNSKDVYN